jgi:hypothetical protein
MARACRRPSHGSGSRGVQLLEVTHLVRRDDLDDVHHRQHGHDIHDLHHIDVKLHAVHDDGLLRRY